MTWKYLDQLWKWLVGDLSSNRGQIELADVGGDKLLLM